MNTHGVVRWLLLALLLLPLLLWWYWPLPREVVYNAYRERGRGQTLATLQGYQSKASEHFILWFTETDRDAVDMILQSAEASYGPVTERLGYKPPTERIPMILYPGRDELRQAFGWKNGESAMGVYWSGTIRLLSPNVWIDEEKPEIRRQIFQHLNPIAHELTHYTLDYLANGNYPRWFTEGLAQYVEYTMIGYLWVEPTSSLKQTLYSMEALDDQFDQLDNQPLAYRQSYLLVEYLVRQYGEENLEALISQLKEGKPFPLAFRSIYGKSEAELYIDWHQWIRHNEDWLDQAS